MGKVKSLSCVQLSATPCTVSCQAPQSMGFSRQEHWSGLPLPSLQSHHTHPNKASLHTSCSWGQNKPLFVWASVILSFLLYETKSNSICFGSSYLEHRFLRTHSYLSLQQTWQTQGDIIVYLHFWSLNSGHWSECCLKFLALQNLHLLESKSTFPLAANPVEDRDDIFWSS